MERAPGAAPRAQGPFHRYGTAPWPQIKGFLGGMEQNPGRGPRGLGFWADPYYGPAFIFM